MCCTTSETAGVLHPCLRPEANLQVCSNFHQYPDKDTSPYLNLSIKTFEGLPIHMLRALLQNVAIFCLFVVPEPFRFSRLFYHDR